MDLGTLQRVTTLQQRVGIALQEIAAAGLWPPAESFEAYLSIARELLDVMASIEADEPGAVPVQAHANSLVQVLSRYADNRQLSGDQAAAAELRHEAETIGARYPDEVSSAAARRERSMRFAAEGRFHEALIGLQEARDVFEREGNLLETVKTELRIANVYEWLGDYERALEVIDAAHGQVKPLLGERVPTDADVNAAIARQVAAIQRGDESTGEGEDTLNLQIIAYDVMQAEGRINRLLGRLDEAEKLFTQARPYLAAMGLAVGVDFHRAMTAVDREDVPATRQLVSQIGVEFEGPMLRSRRGALRRVEADLHLLEGRPDLSLEAAQDGLRDQTTYPDLDLAWKLQWRRGRALAALGRTVEAITAYRDAVSAADQLRMAPLGYRLDSTFVRDKLPMVHEAIDLALESSDGGSVAWFIELVKSRALSATLSVPRGPAAARSPLEASFDATSRRIDALAFALYSGTAPPGALTERVGLLAERDAILEQIRIREPRWRTMTEPVPVDIPAIQARLGDRTAVALLHRDNEVVAAALDRSGVVAGTHRLTDPTTAAITRFAENLRRRTPDQFLFDLSGESHVGLEDLLPPAVLRAVERSSTLLVAPHGLLHLLPWASLTIGGRRLFETAAVGILPNLATFPLLDRESGTDPSVAIIGAADYSKLDTYRELTESPHEIDDLRRVYRERIVTSPLTGPEATEEGFWALAEAAQGAGAVLHFSGHGTLEATDPLASGIVLTGSTVDAAELLMRPLPYEGVVLSACSTAWRPQSARGLPLAGDDALGLPASFLEAGARFLIANVPPVREKASRAFTVAWHRNRRAGMGPLAAYRAVQLAANEAEPDKVFAWAGTTAYGCR